MAIYLGDKKVSGSGTQVDSTLSSTSTRPVENKVITEALVEVGYDAWQKPDSWIDIRSGALPDSVYFLVGHSSDYSTYPTFTVQASVSDSDTYDVYVDGTKQASAVTSATAASLSWSTLALQTGFDVTYPAALRTHIVRVTPTSTGKLTAIKVTAGGVLWAHFTTGSAISLNTFCSNISTLESCTCNANSLLVSDLSQAFDSCSNLVNVPPLDFGGISAYYGTYATFYECRKLQKATIKNVTSGYFVNVFEQCRLLKEAVLENCNVTAMYRTFKNCFALKKLPSGVKYGDALESPIGNCSSLQDTFIDLGYLTSVSQIPFNGSSSYRVDGLKGIILNPSISITGSSPQVDVSYTGLARQALVNLFNSMPTVSSGEVCDITGAIGAADLDATDLAIATGKGWTVTR